MKRYRYRPYWVQGTDHSFKVNGTSPDVIVADIVHQVAEWCSKVTQEAATLAPSAEGLRNYPTNQNVDEGTGVSHEGTGPRTVTQRSETRVVKRDLKRKRDITSKRDKLDYT